MDINFDQFRLFIIDAESCPFGVDGWNWVKESATKLFYSSFLIDGHLSPNGVI